MSNTRLLGTQGSRDIWCPHKGKDNQTCSDKNDPDVSSWNKNMKSAIITLLLRQKNPEILDRHIEAIKIPNGNFITEKIQFLKLKK